MNGSKEENDQNLRTLIFLIFLLLLFLVSSNNQEKQNSKKLSLQNEALSVSISNHDAAFINTGHYDLQKIKSTTDNERLSAFTRSKILVYDHKSASSFIILQKTRLSVIPLFNLRILLHHFPEKDSDPPSFC
jgi:hypothetical protein